MPRNTTAFAVCAVSTLLWMWALGTALPPAKEPVFYTKEVAEKKCLESSVNIVRDKKRRHADVSFILSERPWLTEEDISKIQEVNYRCIEKGGFGFPDFWSRPRYEAEIQYFIPGDPATDALISKAFAGQWFYR